MTAIGSRAGGVKVFDSGRSLSGDVYAALNGSAAPGASNVLMTRSSIAPWLGDFNVRDYGTVADGVTDDTAAIQATIDACATAGGGRVLFPQGRYLISAPLRIGVNQNYVRLQGSFGAEIVNTVNSPHIILGDDVTFGYGATRAGVADLRLTVNAAGNSSQHGILICPVFDTCIIDNVRIGSLETHLGPGGHGIAIVGGELLYKIYNCAIEYCGGDGINLNSALPGGGNMSSIENTTLRCNVGNGLRVQAVGSGGGNHMRVSNVVLEANGGRGILLDAPFMITFENCHLEVNTLVSEITGGFARFDHMSFAADLGFKLSGTSNASFNRCCFSDGAQLNLSSVTCGAAATDTLVENYNSWYIDPYGNLIERGAILFGGDRRLSYERVPRMQTGNVPAAVAAMRGWLYRIDIDDTIQDNLYYTRKSWTYPGTYQHVPLLPSIHTVTGYPITDADFAFPAEGAWGLNTIDRTIAFRMGGIWRAMAVQEITDLTNGLVACYLLSNVDDASGRGNTLTNSGSTTFVVGKVDQCANFVAASSQYLYRADCADVRFGPSDWSLCAWVYLADKTASRFVISKDAAGQREFGLWYDYDTTGLFSVEVFNTDTTQIDCRAATFGPPAASTWCFVCVRHDSTAKTIGISVNSGAEDVVSTIKALHAPGTANFYIGGRQYSGSELYHNGRVDEVGKWSRLLTNAEVEALYKKGHNWPFG